VEHAIMQDPAVFECAVYAVPSVYPFSARFRKLTAAMQRWPASCRNKCERGNRFEKQAPVRFVSTKSAWAEEA
jgi:hypothetical protein